MNNTSNAGHGARLLQVAKKHLLFIEHLGGLVFSLLRIDEDWPKKVGSPVSNPHFLNPVASHISAHKTVSKATVLPVIARPRN